MAYRGRVMVEVEMNIGNLPTTKREDIKIVDQKRIIPYLRRRKYKLFGAFFSATMVDPKGNPVEFEVSIGKHLYKQTFSKHKACARKQHNQYEWFWHTNYCRA